MRQRLEGVDNNFIVAATLALLDFKQKKLNVFVMLLRVNPLRRKLASFIHLVPFKGCKTKREATSSTA